MDASAPRKTEEAGTGVKLSEGHSICPRRHCIPQIRWLSPFPPFSQSVDSLQYPLADQVDVVQAL